MLVYLFYCPVKFCIEPFHCGCRKVGLDGGSIDIPAGNQPVGIPYLVAEITPLLYLALIVEYYSDRKSVV